MPLSLALLAACAPVSHQSQETAVEGVETARTPNPYLAQAGKVPDAARRQMDSARAAYESGDLAAAESALLAITEEWPELSGPWLNLGILYRKMAVADKAEQSLRQSVAANQLNVYAWNELATLLRDAGRFAEAEDAYQQALARWPHYADAHRNLGILFDLYLHQPQQAVHHYRAAQAASDGEDKQLAGWIVDLERRL